MKLLIAFLLASVLFASCQKERIPTTATTRTNTTLTPGNLAVSVDFVMNPEPVTVKVYRYDSTDTNTLELKDSLFYSIPASTSQYPRFRQNTGFLYQGTLKVALIRDSTGQMPYERWVTLTNRTGTIINNDTAGLAVPGYVGLCHVMDVVPKHY